MVLASPAYIKTVRYMTYDLWRPHDLWPMKTYDLLPMKTFYLRPMKTYDLWLSVAPFPGPDPQDPNVPRWCEPSRIRELWHFWKYRIMLARRRTPLPCTKENVILLAWLTEFTGCDKVVSRIKSLGGADWLKAQVLDHVIVLRTSHHKSVWWESSDCLAPASEPVALGSVARGCVVFYDACSLLVLVSTVEAFREKGGMIVYCT